jgi:DNA-binding NarL/FixJ family response regulator
MISVAFVEDLEEISQSIATLIQSDSRLDLIGKYKNAESALAEIEALQPEVVIMDINLPGMNGIEAIRQLKPLCPKTQFMIFTIYENDDKVFEGLKAGASGYILKKTDPNKIKEAIIELSNGGSPMSGHIARKLVSLFYTKETQANKAAEVLSKREKEILDLISKGFLYKEIADKIGISFGTVRQHLNNVYTKLHVHNKTEAINKVYGRS